MGSESLPAVQNANSVMLEQTRTLVDNEKTSRSLCTDLKKPATNKKKTMKVIYSCFAVLAALASCEAYQPSIIQGTKYQHFLL